MTKCLTADQHLMLHKAYPGDCCLCSSQLQLAQTLLDNVRLREEIDQLKSEVETLRRGKE